MLGCRPSPTPTPTTDLDRWGVLLAGQRGQSWEKHKQYYPQTKGVTKMKSLKSSLATGQKNG